MFVCYYQSPSEREFFQYCDSYDQSHYFDFYAFLDQGASLSFVTQYIAMNFDIFPKELLEPFNVSTPIGEYILVDTVFCDCTISINYKKHYG